MKSAIASRAMSRPLQWPLYAAATVLTGCVSLSAPESVGTAATSVATAADKATETMDRLGSAGVPLPAEDLRARIETRRYAADFAATVRHAADRIAGRSSDPGIKANALRWKIGASEQARRAALRTEPQLALVDLWALAVQMDAFLRTGKGAGAFGDAQPIALEASAELLRGAGELAARTLRPEAQARYGALVRDYAAAEPIVGLDLQRTPIGERWRPVAAELGVRLGTVGSTPEVLADVSDRLYAYGEQTPAELRWRGDLYMTETGLDKTIRRMDQELARLGELAATEPDRIAEALALVRADTLSTLTRFDQRWAETLAMLQAERAALAEELAETREVLDAALQRERAELYTLVGAQRAAVTADAERISKDLSELAFRRGTEMMRELAVYLGAVALLLVSAGFAVGFLVARVRGLRRSGATN